MSVQIIDSKSGDKTARYNDIYLHSSYSPKKEAERWANNITSPFAPEAIIITEPALACQVPFLKQKFPECKIGAIRYTHDFDSYNKDFDFVFYAESAGLIYKVLSQNFSEEKIYSVLFLSWQPSEKAFPEQNKTVWKEIKQALETSKTLLVTRQFFEKRWLLNTVNFLKYTKNYHELKKTNLSVLIAASGPSLKDCLNIIKENQSQFIIIALSSAILPLVKNGIKPDFCLSSDGGWWAKEHLKSLFKYDIPLAAPVESAVQKKILEHNKIIPLSYNDGLSAKILNHLGLNFLEAERNPTVSGTALKLAQNLTDSDIYFAGLDLQTSKGFNHTQPNELEINNAIKDNLLSSREKRLFRSSLPSQSLQIYRDWFCAQENHTERVFRIIGKDKNQSKLGKIKDITPEYFCKMLSDRSRKKKTFDESFKTDSADKKSFEEYLKPFGDTKNHSETPSNQSAEEISKIFNKLSQTDEWKKQLFPLDMVALSHDSNNSQIKEKIEKENLSLLEKIQKILKDD